MRAIRFACDIVGTIESDTGKAIQAVAEKITEISWERILEGLFKILEAENSERGMRWLKEQGMLAEILPEMAANEGVPQPEEHHPEGGVLEHSFRALGVANRFDYPPLRKLAVFIRTTENTPQLVVGMNRIGFHQRSQVAHDQGGFFGNRLF